MEEYELRRTVWDAKVPVEFSLEQATSSGLSAYVGKSVLISADFGLYLDRLITGDAPTHLLLPPLPCQAPAVPLALQ